MKPFELTEIDLDQKRYLVFNHSALFKAEREINRLRGARPEEHVSIDSLMIDGFNRVLSKTGLLPIDLLLCMVWAGLLHEEEKLTIDDTITLLDRAEIGRAEISARVWQAYFKAAGKSLAEKTDDETPAAEEQKKSAATGGSNNGALPG